MANKTFIYAGAEAGGLYRKEASDSDWQKLLDGLPPSPMARAIAIHPTNPDLMYVGTQRGVYLSKDRGDHWERADISEGRIIWSLKFHPDNSQVMFLGTEGSEVYRSDDGGKSWQYLANIDVSDAHQMPFSTRILRLAMESDNPKNMYAALEVGGTARSSDGGKSWQPLNQQFAGDVDLLDQHGVTVASPKSDAVFISNRTGVWRSRDKGGSWENLHLERFSPIKYSTGVQVTPNEPNTLYACVGADFGSDQGGLMRTNDLGDTWERFDRGGSPKSTTFGMGINAQQPEQVYFCSRKDQVFGTQDGGASWKEHPLPDSAKDMISVACASA